MGYFFPGQGIRPHTSHATLTSITTATAISCIISSSSSAVISLATLFFSYILLHLQYDVHHLLLRRCLHQSMQHSDSSVSSNSSIYFFFGSNLCIFKILVIYTSKVKVPSFKKSLSGFNLISLSLSSGFLYGVQQFKFNSKFSAFYSNLTD